MPPSTCAPHILAASTIACASTPTGTQYDPVFGRSQYASLADERRSDVAQPAIRTNKPRAQQLRFMSAGSVIRPTSATGRTHPSPQRQKADIQGDVIATSAMAPCGLAQNVTRPGQPMRRQVVDRPHRTKWLPRSLAILLRSALIRSSHRSHPVKGSCVPLITRCVDPAGQAECLLLFEGLHRERCAPLQPATYRYRLCRTFGR